MKYIFSIFLSFTIFYLFTFSTQLSGQCQVEGTLFINEIGNLGVGSTSEYVELVVVGSSSNPTAPVNLENYIIDDNSDPAEDIGNEPGHLRLGSCFSAVLPGTIILIYNSSPLINPSNNGNGVGLPFLFQTSGDCLIGCESYPNHYSSGYSGCSSGQPVDDLRKYIPMRNFGDVLQIRDPEGNLVHAISWVPKYEFNSSNKTIFFDIPTMSNKTAYFATGQDWYNSSNFMLGNYGNASPGTFNSPENQDFITKLRNGSFSRDFKTSVSVKAQPTSLKNNDGKIEVTISGGTPPYSVLISGTVFNHITSKKFENEGTYIIDGLPANSYNIDIEDNNFCYNAFSISLNKATLVCPGKCTEIGDNTGALCNYSWPNGSSSPVQTVCPTETTTYTLTGIDDNGNTIELNYTVEVKMAKITPNPSIICPNITQVSLSCAESYNSYLWNTGASSPQITVSTAGEYKITVTDQDGCVLKGFANVYDANDPTQIKSFFVNRGFKRNERVIISNLPGKPGKPVGSENSSTVCFNNLANAALYLIEEERNVEYAEEFKTLCDLPYYDKVYITENENFCSEHIDALTAFNNPNEKVIWFHLFSYGGESILFFQDNSQPEEPAEWLPMTTGKFQTEYGIHRTAHNCPWASGTYPFQCGKAFEQTFNAYAYLNFTATGNGVYYANGTNYGCDPGQTFPGPSILVPVRLPSYVRRTRIDGIYTGHFLVPNGEGVIWYEAKCVANGTVFDSAFKDYQLSSHLWNLRCNHDDLIGNEPDERKANFIIAATEGTSIAANLVDESAGPPTGTTPITYLRDRNVYVGLHMVKSYYRKVGTDPEIIFKFACPAVLQFLIEGEIHISGDFPSNPVFIQCSN